MAIRVSWNDVPGAAVPAPPIDTTRTGLLVVDGAAGESLPQLKVAVRSAARNAAKNARLAIAASTCTMDGRNSSLSFETVSGAMGRRMMGDGARPHRHGNGARRDAG